MRLQRERRKERERKIAHRIAKIRTIGAIPGVNGIEWAQCVERSLVDDADQVEAGVGDGSRAAGEAEQWQNRALRPDFGIFGSRRFQLRQRENHISDGAGSNQQSAMHLWKVVQLAGVIPQDHASQLQRTIASDLVVAQHSG